MLGYTSTKHSYGWSKTKWNKIDFTAFGHQFKSLAGIKCICYMKFVHDLQPLGANTKKTLGSWCNNVPVPMLLRKIRNTTSRYASRSMLTKSCLREDTNGTQTLAGKAMVIVFFSSPETFLTNGWSVQIELWVLPIVKIRFFDKRSSKTTQHLLTAFIGERAFTALTSTEQPNPSPSIPQLG
jgi:hypothetical protein